MLRRARNRAALTYDAAAILPREVGARMIERLQYIKREPRTILDLGGAAGHAIGPLRLRYPSAQIIEMDMALQMLRAARARAPWWRRGSLPLVEAAAGYVCADADRLPLREGSLGMVWSNLYFHCFDLGRAFAEVHRVLEPGGILMFSTLGPDTLKELRFACTAMDDYPHVGEFTDLHDVGDALVEQGFAAPVMDMEVITITYSSVDLIAGDLKAQGASNLREHRRRGLLSPSRWQAMVEQYESLRRDGSLPASCEVIYGHAWKPEARARTTSDGRKVIEVKVRG
jgi:malonyl-CoA O-methyltransferase